MPSELPLADCVAARFPFAGFAVDHLAFPDLWAVLFALFLAFPPWGALGATP